MSTITIHEHTGDDGSLVRTLLSIEDERLVLTSGTESLVVPDGALPAIMRKFGKPLDPDVALALREGAPDQHELHVEERLALDGSRELVRFRFLHRYDVVARDYLAWMVAGEEPVCELSTAVTAALDHLARRLASLG